MFPLFSRSKTSEDQHILRRQLIQFKLTKMTLVLCNLSHIPQQLVKSTSQTSCDVFGRTQNHLGRIPPQSAQSEIAPGEATMCV